MEGGAAGFLLKDAPSADLSSAIRRAIAGERIVDPGLAAAALTRDTPADAARAGGARDVARHATIAAARAALPLPRHDAQPPVDGHGQLGAHSRAEALRVAEEKGWL